MVTLERALYRIVNARVNIRPENDGIKGYSLLVFETLAQLDDIFNRTKFIGDPLPSEGKVLLIGNHTSLWDAVEAYRYGQKSGRIIRAFARDTLIGPTIKEAKSVANRTGRKKGILNSAPLPIRQLIGAAVAGFDAMPISRRTSIRTIEDLKTQADKKFKQDLAVAMFTMETRDKQGKLTNPRPGARALAENNHDVPIMIMGISVGPRIVRTKQYPCYDEIIRNCEDGHIAKTNFTVYLMDQIAELVDPKIKQDWYEVQRPLILSPRKRS